jgi:Tfp pilus assembly protein PilV
MLIEALVTAFVVAYIAIAVLGHVLLLQAVFTSRKTRTSAVADQRSSHHAPIARARVTA